MTAAPVLHADPFRTFYLPEVTAFTGRCHNPVCLAALPNPHLRWEFTKVGENSGHVIYFTFCNDACQSAGTLHWRNLMTLCYDGLDYPFLLGCPEGVEKAVAIYRAAYVEALAVKVSPGEVTR